MIKHTMRLDLEQGIQRLCSDGQGGGTCPASVMKHHEVRVKVLEACAGAVEDSRQADRLQQTRTAAVESAIVQEQTRGNFVEQPLTWSLPATRTIPKAPSTRESMHWSTTCRATLGLSDFRRVDYDTADTGNLRNAAHIITHGSRLARR